MVNDSLTAEPALKKQKLSESSSSNPTTTTASSLSKFHKWSPQDDYTLKNAAEKGLTAEEMVDTIKFLNHYTAEEISDRWKALLYEDSTAKKAAKNFLILDHSGTKRVPWTEEENAIILDELKKKGFIGFSHIIDKHRDEFHPCRTVKSLEAHFYRLKRNGAFNGIDQSHASSSSSSSSSKALPSASSASLSHRQQTFSEAEEEMFNEASDDARESEAVVRSRRAQERRDAKMAAILERQLVTEKSSNKRKRKSTATKQHGSAAASTGSVEASTSEEHQQSQDQDSYIFALLEGVNLQQKITKEEVVIGRQSQSNTVDVDLSLEGDAGKVSRKQAVLTILAVPQREMLTTIATGTEQPKSKKQVRTISKQDNSYVAEFKLQNIGKRDILVDGVPLKTNTHTLLKNSTASLVFPGNLKFIFKVNQHDVSAWLADYQMVSKSK